MLMQERRAFADALGIQLDSVASLDLLYEQLRKHHLQEVDLVMVGGSGNYSVTSEDDWLHRALDSIRFLYESRKPTFASCWGFQAVSRALGGTVVTDLNRAEVGSVTTHLTEAGKQDPLFSECADPFYSYMGHQDIVTHLPEEAILLASTDKVENQALTFPNRLFYATQFHPELTRQGLLQRVEAYPQYVEKISGLPYDEFEAQLEDAPEMASLLRRFVGMVEAVIL
ncbi:GMP synthase [glutamine-hydrolyzing] [Polystyrenella longa]|uniref:GMP synthase [glutamine-hydrolyzing] n=1 Tax=Polystyrenella longa TaxID=2528007 RepID=A0A518CR68_9PLAN|nr:type 1 glutamine amidotransferase [Polystyrenella longa]QDU81710.1 GMP synthase [glutamine-hydrolyzing] [Polystyrenella longa]